MALCVRIAGPASTASVVEAMARVDVLHKQMAAVETQTDEDGDVLPVSPFEDYYMAGYAVIYVRPRKTKYRPNPEASHWLVFTGYKCRRPHYDAIQAMGAVGRPLVATGSIVDVEEGLLGAKVKTDKWITVRSHGWAGGDDVCLKLEEKLAEAACAALGVPLDADWRAQRATAVETLCDQMGAGGAAARAAPLAELPEWGSIPFGPLSPDEERAQEKAAREHAREKEESRKRRVEESKREADEKRKFHYAPTIERFQGDVPMPSDELCAYMFKAPDGVDTDGSGPDEWRCSYDRKPDSPFCAQCRAMVDLMTPTAKRARAE